MSVVCSTAATPAGLCVYVKSVRKNLYHAVEAIENVRHCGAIVSKITMCTV